MNKIIRSLSNNPFINLANEETLFTNKEECLFLWVNRPSVILGKNQNPFKEINFDFVNQHKIDVVRRKTGGGCVFHDLGNLNFSYIIKEEDFDENKIIEELINVLGYIGIKAYKSGRNDLLLDGRKFCGMASRVDNNYVLFHGSILVDVNLEFLTSSLKPSELKLKSKSIDSVRSRVINLKGVAEVNVEKLIDCFINYYKKNVEYIAQPLNKNLFEYYQDKNNLFQDCLLYQIQHEFTIKNAICSIYLEVENDIIIKAKVFSDSLSEIDFSSLIKVIRNKKYSSIDLEALINKWREMYV